jgi:hypothetical protein
MLSGGRGGSAAPAQQEKKTQKQKKRVIFCSYFQDSPDPCNMFFLPTQEYVNILGWLLEGGEAEKG